MGTITEIDYGSVFLLDENSLRKVTSKWPPRQFHPFSDILKIFQGFSFLFHGSDYFFKLVVFL